jgi:hypothetical protein
VTKDKGQRSNFDYAMASLIGLILLTLTVLGISSFFEGLSLMKLLNGL